MLSVSAVQFFSDAFTWFANLSAKLPKIDFKTYFIVVVALLLGIGLIVGLTYFGSYRFKLLAASKKILRYLSGVDSIDDDNVSDFTAQCFSAKAPSALRDCWVQYLGVRFGYPSEIVSEKSVYDDRVKRVREVRASVYIGIALIMIAIFAFWGSGTLSEADMGVIFCAGLLISGAVYLALVFLNRALSKACLETFSLMQEELDVKVDLQVEKSYATDSSPLAELAAMLDEIIARNTAKDVGFSVDGDEETPLEKLIAGMPPAETNGENEEEAKEKNTSDEAERKDTSSEQDTADISGVKKTEGEAESTEEVKSDATSENANDSSQNETDSEQEETGNKQNETADGEVVDAPKSEQTADQAVEESAPSGTEDVEEVSEPKADKENAADAQQEENFAEKNGEEERSEDESAQPDSHDEQPESCDEQSENVEPTEEQDSSEKDKIEEPDVAAEEPVTETRSSEEVTEEADETSEDTELSEQATAEADDTETEEVKGEEATDSAEVEEEPEEETEQTQEAEDTAEDEVVEEETVEEQVSEQDETPVESVQEEDVEEEAEEEARSDGQEEEPEVKYVVEGPVEDDDIVKPAKLVKLPNLVDYMLARNPSRNILVNISKLLITTHEKFKNSPEDVKIVEKCMNKVLSALQNAR